MSDTRTTTQVQDDAEDIIDLGELFGLLWHYAWLLVIAAIGCGIAGYCFSRFVLPEQFESTTSIYILNRSNNDTSTYNTSELQAGTYLTKDYAELIVSRTVLEQVITELQLPYDYSYLAGKVSVDTPDDTRIVLITVTDTDPREAQSIANEIRVDASALIQDVMGVEAVNVIDEANLPTMKSAPSNTRNGALAAALGFCLVAGFLIVRYITDDTIKTSDDIEKYLGLSTLAIIPLDMQMHIDDDDSRTKKSKRKKKSKKAQTPRKDTFTNAFKARFDGGEKSEQSECSAHADHAEHAERSERAARSEKTRQRPENAQAPRAPRQRPENAQAPRAPRQRPAAAETAPRAGMATNTAPIPNGVTTNTAPMPGGVTTNTAPMRQRPAAAPAPATRKVRKANAASAASAWEDDDQFDDEASWEE